MNWDNVYALAEQLGVISRDPKTGRFDAGETAFLRRQLEHVYTQTYKREYPQLKARALFPVDTSVNEGAATFTYHMWDMIGMAEIIANYADDLPTVDAFATEFSQVIRSIGDGYHYSTQDLRAAALAGKSLDAEKASIARLMVEHKIDDVAAFGDSRYGLVGFLNHPNIPEVTGINGNWGSSATALDILADLGRLVRGVRTQTKDTREANTVIFDTTAWDIVNDTPMSTDNTSSVLETFMKRHPEIRNVERWYKLDNANTAGNGPRVYAYDRSPEVVSLVVPMEFRQYPPQALNLAFKVPCEARIGGIKTVYPLGAAFFEGHI